MVIDLRKYFEAPNLWWHAFRIAAKWNNPRIAARLFAGSIEHLVGKEGSVKPYRVLLLSKAGFREDVLCSIGEDDRFQILSIDVLRNKVFKAIASNFLPQGINDSNYLSDEPDYVEGKNRYRDFLRCFWAHVEKIVRIDVVLTANFSYYAERELSAVLDEMGTPFIVLHKENLKSSGRVEFFKRIYRERRGPFWGTKIFVYNQIERQVQIEAGIATPERIIVTGMPRLDRMHEWRGTRGARSEGTRKCQVLFFAFEPKTGLPSIPRKPGSSFTDDYERIGNGLDDLEWTHLFKEYHHAVLRFASENPWTRVILKAKGRLSNTSPLHAIFDRKKGLPTNFEFAIGGDPFEMIINSSVVCGMNTTALFEALAAGKPVIVPKFAEAVDTGMQAYLVDMEDSVEYASSPEDLIERLKRHVRENGTVETGLSEGVIRILEKWTGNSDGLSGMRVREALLKEISA